MPRPLGDTWESLLPLQGLLVVLDSLVRPAASPCTPAVPAPGAQADRIQANLMAVMAQETFC